MAFLSVDFLLLLPFALVLFHAVGGPRGGLRAPLLLAFSVAFHATWSVHYTALLLGTSVATFGIGKRIGSEPQDAGKWRWLMVGLALLLGQLALFKYAPALSTPLASLVAPLGISYTTFKLVSYLVDVYWEKTEPETDVVAFTAYSLFFPQILSGPIQRARDFLPQLKQPASPDVRAERIVSGLRWILFGVFQKFVVADRLAMLVDRVFAAPQEYSNLGILLAVYAFAIQLYSDFSGLTNVAIGLGLLFGISSHANFDAPFSSPNIQEFWRRWHMTLSSWLTDYVFTPLRMSLRNYGDWGLVLAVVANMLAIGIWHGASWTFVAFGLINAMYVSVSALTLKARNRWFKTRPLLARARKLIDPVVTFHMVVAAFAVFRAGSLTDAGYILTHVLPLDFLRAIDSAGFSAAATEALRGMGLGFDKIYLAIPAFLLCETVVHLHRSGALARIAGRTPVAIRWAGYHGLILATLLFGVLEVREFIYAKF
ncbi:MAG: MBOAT family protein [Myxococcales bacterium]|nr:MBOAT family protein [Myxococcales bacterium]